MTNQFKRVAYATPKMMASRMKLFCLSDQGPLQLSPDSIELRGKNHILSFHNITNVSFERPRISWLAYIFYPSVVANFILLSPCKLMT